ncbi:alkaline phosphatase family protein [Phenylobacterium sp.]|uniref:alkaline phosphatase family protein n=1 Tax=Phenylobacterium sp. TaxID=1871053 RepID=UPI002DF4C0D4|nr:alkaline phosphatase family protein [Phenylobacterium sp.]
MPLRRLFALALSALSLAGPAAAARPHNLILFVADGLRAHIVTPETAPAIAAVRAEGVDFQNSHSLYPTVTTPNASAIATGHLLGDTGDFGNTIYVTTPLAAPVSSVLAPIEDDIVQGMLNQRYDGDYLGEVSLLQAARAKGYATAVLGKLGPVGVQDVTSRDGTAGIVIDDATGWNTGEGVALPPAIVAAIKAAGLPTQAPDRGLNGGGGAYNMPGVLVANVEQQNWFVSVAAKVLLPRFKAQGKPFVLVFWSRDPDGSQHDQGDSLNTLTPGINGPTSLAAIRNASNDLQALREAVARLGLAADTDIVVTADHGFSVMSRESRTSASARTTYRDVKPGFIPPGFLAIDLAKALKLPLHDAAGLPVEVADGFHPRGGALLGADPKHPDVVVAPNGGSNLIYLPGPDAGALAARIVQVLTEEDYTGGLFVRDGLGPIPGTLPTSAVGLAGSARTPAPDIAISFASFATGCADPELCGAEFGDSAQQQGQGTHGSFGRQDTHNFMAATGPDFRKGFVDPAPVSNADWAPTLARILGLDMAPRGKLTGRVMEEALADGAAPPAARRVVLRSEPATNGFITVLNAQTAAGKTYFDAAGMPGRVIGLEP